MKIANNFGIYREDFKKDTGLDFNAANMSVYVQYYNARMTDALVQLTHIYTPQMIQLLTDLNKRI